MDSRTRNKKFKGTIKFLTHRINNIAYLKSKLLKDIKYMSNTVNSKNNENRC